MAQKLNFNNVLELLDQKELQKISKNIANEIINGESIQYEKFNIELSVPKNIIQLLNTLTDVLPITIEQILSKMATQGLSTMLQGSIIENENVEQSLPIENVEPINKISEQLSDLQSVISRFTDMQKIFNGFDHDSINSQKKNKEKIE